MVFAGCRNQTEGGSWMDTQQPGMQCDSLALERHSGVDAGRARGRHVVAGGMHASMHAATV